MRLCRKVILSLAVFVLLTSSTWSQQPATELLPDKEPVRIGLAGLSHSLFMIS